MQLPNGYKLYAVTTIVHTTATVYVAVKDGDDPRQVASDNDHVGLCHQCSNHLSVGDVDFGMGTAHAVPRLPGFVSLANEDEVEDLLFDDDDDD